MARVLLGYFTSSLFVSLGGISFLYRVHIYEFVNRNSSTFDSLYWVCWHYVSYNHKLMVRGCGGNYWAINQCIPKIDANIIHNSLSSRISCWPDNTKNNIYEECFYLWFWNNKDPDFLTSSVQQKVNCQFTLIVC